jgi:hypothetical protein
MPFYEVVFETGDVSVLNCDTDEEALSGLTEQNRRATQGQAGGPQGGPASRIAKVFKYDAHPASLNEDGVISADVLKSELADLLKQYTDKNGVVNVLTFAEAVTGIAHPMIQGPVEGHNTRYKMESTGELDLAALKG